MIFQQFLSIIEWVADSGVSNYMTLYFGNISYFRILIFFIFLFIIIGNGFSLPVISVCDVVFSGLFYFYNVFVIFNIIKNLLFVRQFITDNNCFMEFDPFGFSVKDFIFSKEIISCNSSGSFYIISFSVVRVFPLLYITFLLLLLFLCFFGTGVLVILILMFYLSYMVFLLFIVMSLLMVMFIMYVN